MMISVNFRMNLASFLDNLKIILISFYIFLKHFSYVLLCFDIFHKLIFLHSSFLYIPPDNGVTKTARMANTIYGYQFCMSRNDRDVIAIHMSVDVPHFDDLERYAADTSNDLAVPIVETLRAR